MILILILILINHGTIPLMTLHWEPQFWRQSRENSVTMDWFIQWKVKQKGSYHAHAKRTKHFLVCMMAVIMPPLDELSIRRRRDAWNWSLSLLWAIPWKTPNSSQEKLVVILLSRSSRLNHSQQFLSFSPPSFSLPTPLLPVMFFSFLLVLHPVMNTPHLPTIPRC